MARHFELSSMPPQVMGLTRRIQQRVPEWSQGWATWWELWLILALGAFLRLWQIQRTFWQGDQTDLLDLARRSILLRAIPVTGIPSSIGTLNAPLSIDVLLPVAAFTNDPLPQVIAMALWNVAGLAVCYVVAARYLGRTAAFWATLLFAVCTPVVEYSRLLWQQDFLPPLLALWLGSLFAGVTHGRRGWFAANVGLLTLVSMLHPVAALLAPVTVAAWLLSPRRPQWDEYVLTAGELGLLAVPTLVWELHSGWVDLGALRKYSAHPASANLDMLHSAYHALGVTSAQPGAGTLYGRLAGAVAAVAVLTCGLLLAGYALLSVRAATSLIRAAREQGEGAARRPHLTRALDALRHMEPRWRRSAVLWLAVTVPVVAMVRHSSPIFPHYFIVLYPSAFLAFGWAMQWIRDSASTRLRYRRAKTGDDGKGGMKTRCVPQAALLSTLCVALAGSAILGQVAQTVIFTASVEGQGFSTASGYSYPLDEMLRAEQTLDQLQQRAHAGLAVVVAPDENADYHRNLT
ncbi:MAG TPA: glycosyltransferase family 39 protein, partial [Ktedonobacterales bacterium]|nr:glycosyltransferase family 39 protein [Ktedonobacterales bacterium]